MIDQLKFVHPLKSEDDAVPAGRPLVILFGLQGLSSDAAFRTVEVSNCSDALKLYEREHKAVLVLGPSLTPLEGYRLLSRCVDGCPEKTASHVVLCAGSQPDLYQEFIDKDRLFYLSRSGLSHEQTHSILRAAVTQFHPRIPGENASPEQIVAGHDDLLDFYVRAPLQTDLCGLTAFVRDTVARLLQPTLAQCLIYRKTDEILVGEDPVSGELRSESAAAGLGGFVARTGETVHLEDVGSDPRFDASMDNPWSKDEHIRLLAYPIIITPGEVLGIVTAVRESNEPAFSAHDVGMLAAIIFSVSGIFQRIAFQNRVEEALLDRNHKFLCNPDIFRREALDEHLRQWNQQGEILRTAPSWLKHAHWIVIATVLFVIAYISTNRIDEYAVGIAVLQAKSKFSVTIDESGIVRSVNVAPGDGVDSGNVLAELENTPAQNVRNRSHRQLRAPIDGFVSDIHLRPGQRVNAGDQVASVIDDASGYELIVLLPGHYAQQIHPGMAIRFKIDNHSEFSEVLHVDRVEVTLTRPIALARQTDTGNLGARDWRGSGVIVHCFIKSSYFHSHTFQDGMTGKAQVDIGSEYIITRLVPALKRFWR